MEVRKKVPCSIIRGGTSKGVYFLEKNVPAASKERDAFLLRVMGSPDKKQIDGLGGTASVTSKVAIIAPSSREDVDVEYTFAQVSIDKPLVSYKGNCGNISSGVGAFAIEEGLVEACEPVTTVRVFNTNTSKIIVEEVRVSDGAVQYTGDCRIPGVPGTASPVRMKFMAPAGSVCGCLLPTGNAVDMFEVPGLGSVEVSIVDVANPLVFVNAASVGMTGRELPSEINGSSELLERLEMIRGLVAVKLGWTHGWKEAAWDTPGVPKITTVAPSQDYVTPDGQTVKADEVDLLGRMMSMQKAHPTYAMTGAMCTAAAAVVPGSVVAKVISPKADFARIRIGNPAGVLKTGVEYESGETEPKIICTVGVRTANLLMQGFFIDKKTIE
ncbi:MAG: PrpF domain-containing protein [Pyramidobacter sp.]|uniref:2-methylaconitate cis-trans isomerase PrpF family protein n=1 Tax=Pyramidobacter sp. TaxID=1943581 RepID=UPI002A7F1878|nr:PrpF domain-containing protein [Pyramidobacter sp.]MDY4031795.1 PrpF domain-containing protein [Pyramidobacter sp.]